MTDNELIEAVATRVMGWKAERCSDPNCQCGVLQDWRLPKGELAPADWNPLRHAADCKQVREQLAERFTHVRLASNFRSGHRIYEAALWPWKRDRTLRMIAETEERAVCLVALKSVGVEIRDELRRKGL